MLRSASREDSIATGVESWEHFCREEARQAASSFLERVRRFKRINATARDVHDSTFTNEFSAAFLEESSVLMASGNTQLGCVNNGQTHSRSFFSRSVSERGRSSTFARNESKTSVRSGASGGSSSGGTKKSWWSQLFKWPKSRRRNNATSNGGLSSSGDYGSRHGSSSSAQRRRVILDGHLQLLDLNETVGPLQWTPCKLVLAEAQTNYQVEIFIPPKSAVPKTTLFCFLIEDVRSTTALELPDSTTSFVIKSQNHGEHVFDADTEVKKRQWIQTLLDCKSSIARSASAHTHLATLPRTPQRTPVRLPNGSASRHTNGVVSVEASPNVRRQRYGVLSSYASSESSEQKRSTLNVGAESDGEDTMVDVTSLIRRLHHSSPSRRRKVQSMFVDSHLNSVHPTVAAATAATNTSCSRYNPPPMFSHSPPEYVHDYLRQPPSLPARMPFSSLPVDCSTSSSSPPPLPKRNPPPRNTCSSSLSSGPPCTSASPNHLPSLSPSHSSNAPHSLPAATNRLASSGPCSGTSDTAGSTTARALISPRRKYSQPCIDIPPTIPSDSSQGNLELCSQSSSSSALHPVSLAAMQRSMGNGRRRSSITSNPGDASQPMSLMNVQQPFQSPNERVRKMSAPVLTPGGTSFDESSQKQKTLFNGISEQEDEHPSGGIFSGAAGGETNTALEAGRERRGESEVREKEADDEGEEDSSTVVADSAPSLPQRPDRVILLDSDDYDETKSRKATFTFPYNSSSQGSGGRGTPPPRRTSSPLCVHHRTAGSSSPQGTPDLVTSQLSFQRQEEDNGGLMTGTLVAGTVGGGGGPLSLTERSMLEGRGQRSQSQASNRTDPSTRTNSSSDEVESAGAERGGSMPAINNPIYVETTEGGVAEELSRPMGQTQHPYEHWATNEQDIANLRLLSRYPWFHGMVSRANASQLVLTDGENGTGQYLVRQSESREGDFVLTFNYHNRAKHLRMAVDDGGCNIQHLWFDDVPNMLDYFKTNSIPLESFWLNDDVKLTRYIDRQASDSFRTTTVVNVDRLSRVPPRRSRSLHLGMANNVNAAAGASNSSNPGTPASLDTNGSSPASSSNSQSTNSLPQSARNGTGWRLFRSQRSSSAGNVGRVQRRHSANVGSLLSTGPNSHHSSGRTRRNNNNTNAYVTRNY